MSNGHGGRDQGVIKYDRSDFVRGEALDRAEFVGLEGWRRILFLKGLVGEYTTQRVGYGNVSQREDYCYLMNAAVAQFVISGTQTGGLKHLDGRHYTRVLDHDLDAMKVWANGPLEASSEALTHAAIYQCSPGVEAVFHVHNFAMWRSMLDGAADRTPEDVEYGTREMAAAVQRCVDRRTQGSFAMAGHHDGIVAYGESLDQCGNILLELHERLHE